MTFSEFKKEYDGTTNKDQYLKKHITKKYVSILNKISMFKGMILSSIVNDPFPHFDNVVLEINRLMSFIALYTDIEPDDVLEEQAQSVLLFDMYDWFKENAPLWENNILAQIIPAEKAEADYIWALSVQNAEEQYLSDHALVGKLANDLIDNKIGVN